MSADRQSRHSCAVKIGISRPLPQPRYQPVPFDPHTQSVKPGAVLACNFDAKQQRIVPASRSPNRRSRINKIIAIAVDIRR